MVDYMCFSVCLCALTSAVLLPVRAQIIALIEAECLTGDGSAGRCLAPSDCPPSHSSHKPVLCRYSRGYGMRICCRSSPHYQEHEDYNSEQPIAFPSELEDMPGYRPYRPSTNAYDNHGYSKPPYHRPTYNERPNSGSYGEHGYNERPSYNNPPTYERPEFGVTSSNTRPNLRPDFGGRPSNNNQPNYGFTPETSFGRPDYNGGSSYNNRPNYGSSEPSFGRPDYNERPENGRPSYNNQPNYGTSSSEPSFGRPDYNERPANGRPPYNNQPDYGTSSSQPSFGRPDYNERPVTGKPSYNNQPSYGKPRPDIWGFTDSSSEQYPNSPRPTKNPSWSLGDNDDSSSSRNRISERKCEEYSQSVTETLNPLPLSINSEAVPLKVQKCDFSAVQLIVGGERAQLGEFPHMAAVGFRTPRSRDVSWNCGGTLISDLYVLTAAHCVNTTYGKPSVIRLGEYNLERDDDGANPEDYGIEKIIPHPEYTKSRKYNDIALLRLSRRVRFNKWVRPACLSTEVRVRGSPIATGWGRTHFVGKLSDTLMKVNLNVIGNQQCNSYYQKSPGTASFSSGIIDTMLCAGDLQGGRDTCLGDSGGPLSVTKSDNPCVHYIVGITSFGKICGAPQSPGVYTRVSKYLPWIERTVWPNS